MKKRNRLALFSLMLCMVLLTGCGTNSSSAGSSESSNENAAATASEQPLDHKQDSDKKQDIVESGTNDTDESEAGDSGDTTEISSTLEKARNDEKAAEAISDEPMETADPSEKSDIQIGSVGTVKMTVLSGDDSKIFSGKEMTADSEYLEQAQSSEVYYCEVPLDRIEVHPIRQWAADYSSYTFSEKILGVVKSTGIKEPFRIYDVFPEGIPTNCVVFYTEDGTCGTFSLGYNGSGEEQSWDNAVYRNYESMEASREAEQGTVPRSAETEQGTEQRTVHPEKPPAGSK